MPLTPPHLRPIYFVLNDEGRVLCYARVIRARVSHLGRSFMLYGLGDVITAPRSRLRGYGGRIVQAATAHIRTDREADAALLLTQPGLEAFYRRSGWELVPGLRVATDETGEHEATDLLPMMLFLSPAVLAARGSFQEETLILPGDEW